MMNKQIKSLAIVYRENNIKAKNWAKKIELFVKKQFSKIIIFDKKPSVVLVLGGDGTILETARKYQKSDALIFGMNLGNVGFLASVRKPENFLTALKQFFTGNYFVAERMMLASAVYRSNKIVFKSDALNDIVVQNPLGIVEIEVNIENYPFQYVSGTGVLVSTATGSTAYNLSAHGPIVMPDIKCMILSELLDHNIPTPSVVIKYNKEIELKIADFRERGLLSVAKTEKPADVLLIADGENIFSLQKNDIIKIQSSPRLVKFVELEKNYFFKSLQEKFAFK